MTRPIFFLTDFGHADTYVGIVKAVILGIAPDARIVDLTHEIPPQDVRAGAYALRAATPYLPHDAVVLAVVDPGVGTARRPILVQTASGRTFVGPDNGLLAWATAPDNAGSSMGITLDRPQFWLPSVSATFQGRDLFGPVAAHLARGVAPGELGGSNAPIQAFPFPGAVASHNAAGNLIEARGEVVHVDWYGNLITCLGHDDLPPDPVFEIGGHRIAELSPHFQVGQPGTLVALVGSTGLVEIAATNASAASILGVGVGATVTVTTKARHLLPSAG